MNRADRRYAVGNYYIFLRFYDPQKVLAKNAQVTDHFVSIYAKVLGLVTYHFCEHRNQSQKNLGLRFFVSKNGEVTAVTFCDDLTDTSVTKMMNLSTLFCLINVLVIVRVTATFEQ